MKKHLTVYLAFGLGIVLTACSGAALVSLSMIGIIPWGFDNQVRVNEWTSPDGRLSLQSQIDGMSTAWDCWPTSKTRATEHSLCELTLNRYQWDHERLERISLSAMADQTDDGAYRISIEKGRTGEHRPLIVCFDNAVPGGLANCPLKVSPQGVFVQTEEGYKKL